MQKKGHGAASTTTGPQGAIRPEAMGELVNSSKASISTEITPEIMTVIETAVGAYLGKRARIVSVRLVSESRPEANPWLERGRDMIHRSHNIVQRGH